MTHAHEEPEGFAQWLGYHAVLTSTKVPPAGSDHRADLERRYRIAVEAGYAPARFRAASVLALAAATPEAALAHLDRTIA